MAALPDGYILDGPAVPDGYVLDTPPSAFQAATDAAGNMMTFGLKPVASGLGYAAGEKLTGNPASFSDLYSAGRNEDVANQSAGSDAHPYASIAGGAAGILGNLPRAATEGAATVGRALWNGIKAQTPLNAGLGFATGFGSQDGSMGDRLTAGARDAAINTGIGALIPTALTGAGRLVQPIANAAKIFTRSGQEAMAGRVINEATSGSKIVPQPTPLEGMQLSSGQAANSPGLMWLDRSMQQSSPHGAQVMAQRSTANNQAMRGAMGTIGDTSLAPDAPVAMAEGLEAGKGANKAIVDATWKTAGIDNSTPVPTKPLIDQSAQYIASLPKAYQSYLGADIMGDFGSLGANEPLNEIQAIRSKLGSAANTAFASGDTQKGTVIKGLADIVGEHTENPNVSGLSPEQTAAYQQARAETYNLKQNFTQPKDIRNVLGTDRYGADKVPLSATADQFIKTGRGASEAFNSFMNAVNQAPPEAKQAALDAARGHFAQKMLDKTGLTGKDTLGDSLVSPAKIDKFVKDYGHVINSGLLTDAQRATIASVQNAAHISNRSNLAGQNVGSDTFAKISGGKFLDALLGRSATTAKIAAGGLSAVGGLHVGGPIGAIVAGFEGSHLAQKLFDAPKAKITEILSQAMQDPELAASLQMKANPIAEHYMPPRIKMYLGTVLGAKAARVANPIYNTSQPLSQFYQQQGN